MGFCYFAARTIFCIFPRSCDGRCWSTFQGTTRHQEILCIQLALRYTYAIAVQKKRRTIDLPTKVPFSSEQSNRTDRKVSHPLTIQYVRGTLQTKMVRTMVYESYILQVTFHVSHDKSRTTQRRSSSYDYYIHDHLVRILSAVVHTLEFAKLRSLTLHSYTGNCYVPHKCKTLVGWAIR